MRSITFIHLSIFISVVSGAEPKLLVGNYPLDGNALDYSAYLHDGTNINCVQSPFGRNGCLYFNGTNAWVDLGNPEHLRFAKEYTVAAWYKRTPGNNYNGIVGKNSWYGQSVGMFGWMLYMGNHGSSDCLFDRQFRQTVGCGQELLFTYSDQINDGTDWHYVAGVMDGIVSLVYVDGIPTGGRVLPYPFCDSGQKCFIGRTYDYHKDGFMSLMHGYLDEVKLWNYALDASTIRAMYEIEEGYY